MENYFENLRRYRKQKGFSQADMAEKMGITQDGYSKMERGIIQPSLSRVAQLAEVLGVSAKAILFGDEENTEEAFENITKECNQLKEELRICKELKVLEGTRAKFLEEQNRLLQDEKDFVNIENRQLRKEIKLLKPDFDFFEMYKQLDFDLEGDGLLEFHKRNLNKTNLST